MRLFEISKKAAKNGRRHFKMVLLKIHPDSCVHDGFGSEFNENGLTWLRKYCEAAAPTIKGMSLRAEFLDEERTELCGHGETGIVDDLPVFENAVVLGTFDEGHVEELDLGDGMCPYMIGTGYIDEMCYFNFVKKLEQDIAMGFQPKGSVEIYRADGMPSIIYEKGNGDEMGRIPKTFRFSGYALLGVRPADSHAQILELNQRKENKKMDKDQIKEIVELVMGDVKNALFESNKVKEECEKKVCEAQALVDMKETEKVAALAEATEEIQELKAKIAELEGLVSAATAEKNEAVKKIEEMNAELDKAKVETAKSKLAEAMKCFSDDEKSYVKNELEAFDKDPLNGDIDAIVNKVYAEIGKNSKTAQKVAEQNAATHDIFAPVENSIMVGHVQEVEEVDIFRAQ